MCEILHRWRRGEKKKKSEEETPKFLKEEVFCGALVTEATTYSYTVCPWLCPLQAQGVQGSQLSETQEAQEAQVT